MTENTNRYSEILRKMRVVNEQIDAVRQECDRLFREATADLQAEKDGLRADLDLALITKSFADIDRMKKESGRG